MNCLATVSRYASLVKFSHTIFALPFALVGYVYALQSNGLPFEWPVLVKVLLAMVLARNTAMGFNRWADRRIDAQNPRTSGREIPSGTISARNALWFVVLNAVLFVLVAWWINPLALALSPVALLVLTGYSLTKRFTAWCHIVLGVALGIAPIGAYVAVTGQLAVFPILLCGLVITWCGGFDIVYALQDVELDRKHGLHSVPARWGVRGGIAISIALHLTSVYAVVVAGTYYDAGGLYWVGAALFVGLLTYQHMRFTPRNLSRIGLSFGTMNGLASVCYAAFAIADLLVRYR